MMKGMKKVKDNKENLTLKSFIKIYNNVQHVTFIFLACFVLVKHNKLYSQLATVKGSATGHPFFLIYN